MQQVLVVDPNAREWHAELARDFPELQIRTAELIADAGDLLVEADVLISMCLELTSGALARMPRLGWIQSLISGYEHLRPVVAGRDDLIITTMRGIHGPQMAEAALFHMLCAARDGRRIFDQQSARHWEAWEPSTLAGKTVAIVGLGAAGRSLAPVCRAIGMRVLGVTRTAGPVRGVDVIHSRENLRMALPLADYVVLMAPAQPDGAPLLGAEELDLIKPTAAVVNMGRGSLIDERALEQALSKNRLKWAGLDVFAREPLPSNSPLWTHRNVVVTPHLGGHNDRYIEQALAVIRPNLEHYLAGDTEAMINRVTF